MGSLFNFSTLYSRLPDAKLYAYFLLCRSKLLIFLAFFVSSFAVRLV